MKVVFITGNHIRHMFIAKQLHACGGLAGLVVEEREAFLPAPPPDIPKTTASLFIRHFEDRALAEERFFGDAQEFPSGVRLLQTTKEELNGPAVNQFLGAIGPDLILSYGCHLLTQQTLEHAPERWNIHGGLSPWYRGAATHFWPSYFLEPQMTGATVHDTIGAVDGGDIIHQTLGPLVRGDGIHDIACRTIHALGLELPRLMEHADRHAIEKRPQKTSGRIWRIRDWRPEHLHLVYDLYDNRVVDRYLDGLLTQREPLVHRLW